MPLERIGEGVRRDLVANEAARKRIAHALDLVQVLRLQAKVEVRPRPLGGVVAGQLSATVVQTCGVSLEAFETEVTAKFEAPYTTAPLSDPDPREELGLADLDQPDFIKDGVIDLGQYVVEHLALELDPFPRKPGVTFEPPAAEKEPGAFDKLAQLHLKPAND